jgi:hypothetical protein
MESEKIPKPIKPDALVYTSFEQETLEQLKAWKTLEGKYGILVPLIKRLVEAGLEGELDIHLEEDPAANRRNGKMRKKIENDPAHPKILLTESGIGYRMSVEEDRHSSSPPSNSSF